MELFLLELSHKNFQNRKIALMENGSWAPTAAKTMMKYIEQMKNITLIEPVITLKSRMNAQNEEQMKDLAEQL